jgi:hypothetical protein
MVRCRHILQMDSHPEVIVRCRRVIIKMDTPWSYQCGEKNASPRMGRLCKGCREMKHCRRWEERQQKLSIPGEGWYQRLSPDTVSLRKKEYHRRKR